MSKPSGGIRSLPSLSAWGLPTPVVALACIGNVDIRLFFLCKWVTLFHTTFASLSVYRLSCTTDFTRSYASFFLYWKEKKKQKKKRTRLPLYCMAMYHTKIIQEIFTNKNPPAGRTGGLSAVTLPFLQLKLGRRVSGDPPLSLLKRKKEAKKEKSSRFTCTIRSNIARRYNIFRSTKIPRRGEQAACPA